jgi:RNA 3'-terminal phosphate cyclase
VAHALLDDLDSGATIDRHLADHLIIFAALASGASEFRIPQVTDHVHTNIWLVEDHPRGYSAYRRTASSHPGNRL